MSKPNTTKSKRPELPKPKFDKSINNKQLPISNDKIDHMKSMQNEKLIFSFKFLELNHPIFNLGGTCVNWPNDLFKLLFELSDITRNDFVNGLREHYRSHIHEWEKLNYKYNLTDEFLEQVECRQARISTSKGGIHGFIIGNHFYIVWLDPHHNLYPDDKFGGVKRYEPPETCCGYRDSIINGLNEKITEYENILEELTAPN